ncbi:MAG: hypothetical protein GXP43_03675 [bacterium]|nr:hypothetical protein [bacterium]
MELDDFIERIKLLGTPLRRKQGQSLAKLMSLDELAKLIQRLKATSSKAGWDLIAHLITVELYEAQPELVIDLIKSLACHDNWEIREEAASVIKRLNQKYFDQLYPVYLTWTKGNNLYLKRAVSVGLIKKMPREDKQLSKIYILFENIMQSDDAYVKKNCGPFGLAAVFRRHPVETEKQIGRGLKKYSNHPTVIWNIMMIFSQANAKYFKSEGQRILAKMKNLVAKQPKLSRAYKSVLKKLS